MIFTTKGRYGLRAMVDLALYAGSEPASISSIAARQDISEGYLEQLIARLKSAGLVESVRGVGGGYRLARSAEDINVYEILSALEGGLHPIDCPEVDESIRCEYMESCVTKTVWRRIDDAIEEAVSRISLAELCRETEKAPAEAEIAPAEAGETKNEKGDSHEK